jgi:hypothetical protein
MHWNDIPFRPPPGTLRRFGIFGFLLLSGLGGWQAWHDRWVLGATLLAVAIVLFVMALVRPAALQPIFAGLMVATFPLNWVMSHVVMGLVFYGIFTPLGLFFRVIGRDVLARRFQPTRSSYWTKKPRPEGIRSYFRQS